jgi:hypothetical protein
MQTILTLYVVVAVIGSAVFLLVGIRERRRQALENWPIPPDDTGRRRAEPFDGSQPADVGSAASVALNRIVPQLRDRGVWLDVAIRPGLLVRETGHNLADALEQMLIAMTGAGNRRVLLSAAPHGSQVAITVTNDARSADLGTLRNTTETLAAQMALRGSSLDADIVPDQGTSMVLRLAAAGPRIAPTGLPTSETPREITLLDDAVVRQGAAAQ